MFKEAKHPDRIFVGVVWQIDPEADGYCFEKSFADHAQVRSLYLHHGDAKGPCFARALAQTLWRGETYFLQIDSHMRFVQDWDEMLLTDLKSCPSSKPILSTYPPPYELGGPTPTNREPLLLCASQWGELDHMLRIKGRKLDQCPSQPLPSLFLAAGLLFGSSDIILQAPYDPNLRNLFFGEEISLALRLWTHGFDFFTPRENMVYHLWTREYRPTFRENMTEADLELEDAARRTVRAQLGLPVPTFDSEPPTLTLQQVLDSLTFLPPPSFNASTTITPTPTPSSSPPPADTSATDSKTDTKISPSLPLHSTDYGLGSVRTLAEFENHIGINFTTREISAFSKNGGQAEEVFQPDQLALLMRIMQQQTGLSMNMT